jgi:hypothetical protein
MHCPLPGDVCPRVVSGSILSPLARSSRLRCSLFLSMRPSRMVRNHRISMELPNLYCPSWTKMPPVWDQHCSSTNFMTNSRFVSVSPILPRLTNRRLHSRAVPAEALNNYTPNKRSVSVTDIAARSMEQGRVGQIGDRPWFCWFNQTILEFFIYLEHNTTSSTPTSAFSPSSTSMPRDGMESSTFPAGYLPPTPSSDYPSSQPTWPPPRPKRAFNYYRRDEENWRDTIYATNYPLWIKLQEKRKPENNVQPYCQQMRILETQMIVPQEGVSIINVTEIEPASSNRYKRTNMDGTTTSLDSNCVCEWLATT